MNHSVSAYKDVTGLISFNSGNFSPRTAVVSYLKFSYSQPSTAFLITMLPSNTPSRSREHLKGSIAKGYTKGKQVPGPVSLKYQPQITDSQKYRYVDELPGSQKKGKDPKSTEINKEVQLPQITDSQKDRYVDELPGSQEKGKDSKSTEISKEVQFVSNSISALLVSRQ